MGHLYFLLGLGALLLLSFLLSLRQSLKSRFNLPYIAEERLFTPEQLAFKAVLARAVGRDFEVHGQVRVADLIGVSRRVGRRGQERAHARMGERCFDFVVCHADTSAIACAINLVALPRLRKRLPRDSLDRICAAARLPFLRFCESGSYSVVEIEERVFAAMRERQEDAKERIVSDDEMSTAETSVVLRGLSEVILDERRPSRVQERPAPPSRQKQRDPQAQSDSPPSTPVENADRRVEPVILDQDEIDEGPTFRIDGDLEDDRSARVRRT